VESARPTDGARIVVRVKGLRGLPGVDPDGLHARQEIRRFHERVTQREHARMLGERRDFGALPEERVDTLGRPAFEVGSASAVRDEHGVEGCAEPADLGGIEDAREDDPPVAQQSVEIVDTFVVPESLAHRETLAPVVGGVGVQGVQNG